MVVPVAHENGRWYYRCLYLAPNGDCSIYATRPAVCFDYPFYGDPEQHCSQKNCSWDCAGGVSLLRKTVIGCKKAASWIPQN
jgi:Fe-S-cluster containining protein